VTGRRLPDAPATIEERQAEIAALHAEFFPARKPPARPRLEPARPVELDDAELLQKAEGAAGGAGADFGALWRGDTSGHDSDDSRADYALARHLHFWTQGDAPRMERLMRLSGLRRDKWDDARPGGTYLAVTIEKAIEAGGEVYRPSVKWEAGRHPKPH